MEILLFLLIHLNGIYLFCLPYYLLILNLNFISSTVKFKSFSQQIKMYVF